MRPVRRLLTASLVAASLTALFVSAASARVQTLVPQSSIRGVKVGMVASQVRSKLGRPDSNRTLADPILGKTRMMRFGLVEVRFRGVRSNSPVINISTTSKKERTASGIGVGSSERALRAALRGETCRTELGYRHCWLGQWKPGSLITDFSISKSGRVTRLMLGIVID